MIRLDNIHKQFGSLAVLKGISLEVEKGEVVAIIGPSGSGKSTLLRCINLLERPNKGGVYINNQEITHLKADLTAVRQNIGMGKQQSQLPIQNGCEPQLKHPIQLALHMQIVKRVYPVVRLR